MPWDTALATRPRELGERSDTWDSSHSWVAPSTPPSRISDCKDCRVVAVPAARSGLINGFDEI